VRIARLTAFRPASTSWFPYTTEETPAPYDENAMTAGEGDNLQMPRW
jgi:hypothetical protein